MHAVDFDRGDTESATRRRWKWLGVLSVGALLLHAAALSGLERAWLQRETAPSPAAPMQVRVVDAVVPVPLPAVAAPVADPVLAPKPVPARSVGAKVAVAPARALPPPADLPEASAVELATAAPLEGAISVTNAAPNAAGAAVAAAGEEMIPRYRTQVPPATTLRYEVQRGVLHGTGELSWRPQGDRYELRLDARVSGLAVLTQVSAGGFDADGVAPERFTDQRLRRGTTAANFQRAAGKITFSDPSTEFALRDGAQDRLSWMVQLAAIVAAEPQLSMPGAKVSMYVVGSHGDAGVWVFRCVGPEVIQTRAGPVDAVKFMREPRDPNDTTVQVWLDPHRHDLPVRALQRSGPNDDGYELRLQEAISN